MGEYSPIKIQMKLSLIIYRWESKPILDCWQPSPQISRNRLFTNSFNWLNCVRMSHIYGLISIVESMNNHTIHWSLLFNSKLSPILHSWQWYLYNYFFKGGVCDGFAHWWLGTSNSALWFTKRGLPHWGLPENWTYQVVGHNVNVKYKLHFNNNEGWTGYKTRFCVNTLDRICLHLKTTAAAGISGTVPAVLEEVPLNIAQCSWYILYRQ